MPIEQATIVRNSRLAGDYFLAEFLAPAVCPEVQPGQFAHVQISALRDRLLRRPFSICDVTPDGRLTIVYKVIGEGTALLSTMVPGQICDILGPQGNPYRLPAADEFPVIVAGGYGLAATYLLAKRSPAPGAVLVGARSGADLVLLDKFADTRFAVQVATESGDHGVKGLVTDLLGPYLDMAASGAKVRFYSCGPNGMTRAFAKILAERGLDAELSVDRAMCCGVGACFACVVKAKDSSKPSGWKYVRTCKEGPVFMASDLWF